MIAVAFNVIVAAVFKFFGAALSTCWFTFLGLTLFAALGEVDLHLYEIDKKLDPLLKDKAGHVTPTMS